LEQEKKLFCPEYCSARSPLPEKGREIGGWARKGGPILSKESLPCCGKGDDFGAKGP